VGQGQQEWAVAATIMPTMRGQFLTTTAAAHWAGCGAFNMAITAAADKRQQQEQMGLQQLIVTALHNHFGKRFKTSPASEKRHNINAAADGGDNRQSALLLYS
jgi:hypothetical protein